MRPIDEIYRRELQKLFSKLTRDGRLEEAVLVKSEDEAVAKNSHLAAESDPGANSKKLPELVTLRQSWVATRLRAVEPKNQSYVRELARLQDNYTRSKRLEDALAVKDEIEKVRKGNALSLIAAGGDATFVEKSWRTGSGSTFIFKADGTGTQANASGRQWPTRWSMDQDGLVTVDGWADDQRSTWYFRFTEENRGSFGSTSEILNNSVSAQ